MRKTEYAEELARGSFSRPNSDSEARIERLKIESSGEEEIRFSWWKDRRLMMRPLDLNEDDLLHLMEKALAREVFTKEFRAKLRKLL